MEVWWSNSITRKRTSSPVPLRTTKAATGYCHGMIPIPKLESVQLRGSRLFLYYGAHHWCRFPFRNAETRHKFVATCEVSMCQIVQKQVHTDTPRSRIGEPSATGPEKVTCGCNARIIQAHGSPEPASANCDSALSASQRFCTQLEFK